MKLFAGNRPRKDNGILSGKSIISLLLAVMILLPAFSFVSYAEPAETAEPAYAEWTVDIDGSAYAVISGVLPADGRATVEPTSIPRGSETAFSAYVLSVYDGNGEKYVSDEGVTVELHSDKIAAVLSDGNNVGVLGTNRYGYFVSMKNVYAYGDAVTFRSDCSTTVYLCENRIVKTLMASDGNTYRITVRYDGKAHLPEDAEIRAEEIALSDAEYLGYLQSAAAALGVDVSSLTYSKLFDISIVDGAGNEYQPDENVNVTVELMESEAGSVEDLRVVHFGEEDAPVELQATTTGKAVTFETDGFSVFSFNDTSLSDVILNAVFGESKLYENDDIVITGRMPLFGTVEATPVQVQVDGRDSLVAYDIKIYANNVMKLLGIPWQPSEGAVRVTVKSDVFADAEGPLSVYHMQDENSEPDYVASAEPVDSSVSFDALSFSVYVVVRGPSPVSPTARHASTMADLTSADASRGFLLSLSRNGGTYYVRSNLNSNSAFVESTDMSVAAPWYLEKVEYPNDQPNDHYYIYTASSGNVRYITAVDLANSNNVSLSETDKTEFVISEAGNGTFYIKAADRNKWLQHSNGGNGIRLWTDNNNAANSKFTLTYISSLEPDDDPYGLDGVTHGLMSYGDGIMGEGLMASTVNSTTLRAQDMIVRPNPVETGEYSYIAEDRDITTWTFHSVGADLYSISTVVNGETVYLKLTENGLSTTTWADATAFQFVPGTGSKAGQFRLISDGYAITYAAAKGFNSAADTAKASQYFYFVDPSTLEDGDFVVYSAAKVSVSDPSVTNGSRVIVYTRYWDDEEKKYIFYAIDHDGSLVRCYETGNSIEWVGSELNTLLWNLTEYYWEGTTTPNYYYELYNQYSRKYIAPQIGGGQILSDNIIGINLEGRRFGDYYTSIVAWDDPYYAYASLTVEDGQIVSVPYAEAGSFFFAILEDPPETGELVEVPTVDHTQFGITMKIADYSDIFKVGDTTTTHEQDDVLGNSDYVQYLGVPGLLSTNLSADGYPTATNTGTSLSTLFTGDNVQEVNHLFIGSTYNGTGYFVYDSTQNFASLQPDGNFKVYKELATTDSSNKPSLKHGQFFPYNDIDPTLYASVNGSNLYNAEADPLSDDDPRKYEQLYLIRNPNYYFGVEIEAQFVQTPNGLDEWGHDIIYEFTGDDDFWLYVDGELIIDLGGIHSALPGSVNYSTGEVKVNGNNTTIKDLFVSNYRARGMSDAQIAAKVDEIFELNENGQYLFKDYTSHTMKIFYMERGGSASNLYMRFNLSSVKPGQVILQKKISGIDNTDYRYAEYPFRVWYKTNLYGDPILLDRLDGEGDATVTYQNTTIPVTYRDSFTPAGATTSYENVFILKPGQVAAIDLPENAIYYWIEECGVNTDVYDYVTINGTVATGTHPDPEHPEVDPNRLDYSTGMLSVEENQRVVYDNHVMPEAKRTVTVTKTLFDAEGTPIHDDDTGFNLRLYLGSENVDLDGIVTAPMRDYCVRDADGNYCSWDADAQEFVSVGKTDYSLLTDAEKIAVTYQTSFNGAISKIPSDHSIEIRDVLVGMKFMAEERAWEIPDGYTFIEYVRTSNDVLPGTDDTENSGMVRAGESPVVEVRNRRGFSITVNKVWSDASFMESHGDVYFAVYINGSVLDGSIRRLSSPDTSVVYYWDTLAAGATGFSDYVIREVMPSGSFTVDDETGVVTPGAGFSLTVYEAGHSIRVPAKPLDEEESNFDYEVAYEVGQIEGGGMHVRTDTVSNSRHGIRLVKEDWNGNPLAGVDFTLTDENGQSVGAGTYTTGDDGVITIAYVNVDTEYFLTETKVPTGYHAVENPIVFIVDPDDGSVSVTQCDDGCYELTQATADSMATITVKNRAFRLEMAKVGRLASGVTAPLSGAHFAIYREVTVDGVTRMDYYPMTGYEDLVSAETTGLILTLDTPLNPGSYYLVEKSAPASYDQMSTPARFSIDNRGVVTLTANDAARLSASADGGTFIYTLTVTDSQHPPAPTAVRTGSVPFILVSVAALGVIAVVISRRRKRGGGRA